MGRPIPAQRFSLCNELLTCQKVLSFVEFILPLILCSVWAGTGGDTLWLAGAGGDTGRDVPSLASSDSVSDSEVRDVRDETESG